jgi:hypothetical protein
MAPATIAFEKTRPVIKTKRTKSGSLQHFHDKCGVLLTKMREANIMEAELIDMFPDFLRKVLPESVSQKEATPTTPEHRLKLEVITSQ